MKKHRLLALLSIFFMFSMLFQGNAAAQSAPVPTPPFNYLADPTLGDKVISVTDSKGLLLESYVWAPLPDCASLISVTVLQTNGKYKTLYARNSSPCGSLTALTDENGNVVGKQNFDAFGNLIDSQGATPADKFPVLLGYRQEQQEPSTGLVYMHDRWYDPTTGRFVSADPEPGKVRQPASQHKYSYAQNDPINKFDPTGRVTLNELQSTENNMAEMRIQVGRDFASGLREQGGRLMKEMGDVAEREVGRMIRDCLKPKPGKIEHGAGIGVGKRTIDYIVTLEQQVVKIEVKNRIPTSWGPALRRLKDQLLAAKSVNAGKITVIGAESEGELALAVKYLTNAGLKQGIDFDLIQGLVHGARWMGGLAMEACI